MGNRRLLGATELLVICVMAGCVTPAETTQCGDFTCGAASICSPDGSRCVAPEIVEACQGKSDGDGCSFPGLDVGTCVGQLCVSSGCGNGLVEAQSGERCDDGNRASGDGCRADCKSLETCGDGVQDLAANEQCDCGATGMAGAPSPGCAGFNSDASGAQCRSGCTLARCGDGVLDPFEICDDGNNVPGDGCRADCTGRWTKMASTTLADLNDVYALSKDDAWAVGTRRILHWNGTVWSSVALSAAMTNARFIAVYAASSQDVFVVSQNAGAFRYHLVGSSMTWTDVTPAATPVIDWSSVGGAGSDLWLSGRESGANAYKSRAVHFNGNTFDTPGTLSPGGFDNALKRIGVTPGGTVLASDNQLPDGNIYAKPSNSSTWAIIGGAKGNLLSIAGATEIFTFTVSGTAYVYDGVTFAPIANAYELEGAADMHAIPGLALAVGSQGKALFCTHASCTITDTGTPLDLLGVHLVDATHAFIVGTAGTILY